MTEPVYFFSNNIFRVRDDVLGIVIDETYDCASLESEEGKEGRVPSSFTGTVTYLRHNRTVKSRAAYKEGMLHGPSFSYFSQGGVASERWYKNGMLHGRAIDSSYEGKVLCKKGFFEGRPHGVIERWYPSGKILSSGYYSFGWAEKTFSVFDEAGYLLRSCEFQKGRRHGIDQGWTDDGFLLFCEVWENGERKRSIVKDFFL